MPFLIAALTARAGVPEFLQQHWQRPLPPQGAPPATYSELEASLDPDACGSCHPDQRRDWGASLHSHAMGPGLMGQLLEMAPQARDDQQSCLRCHAPLAEQADALVAEIQGGAANALHRRGVVCAACHVRDHRRYGPARRDGSQPDPQQPLPHSGWTASEAFADSAFCAACHQFDTDGFALNGKLLENTYREWQASPYAEQGVTCQRCHMPDRRHLWKGVHDPATVRDGVSIDARLDHSDGQRVGARLRLTNSGTGHRLPTYVTPQLVLAAYQLDAEGSIIDGSEEYQVIGRRVSADLSEELFDTRLAVGESASLVYRQPRAAGATALLVQVWVDPDFFYAQFYRNWLDVNPEGRGSGAIRQALHNAEAARYTLFEQRLSLTTL